MKIYKIIINNNVRIFNPNWDIETFIDANIEHFQKMFEEDVQSKEIDVSDPEEFIHRAENNQRTIKDYWLDCEFDHFTGNFSDLPDKAVVHD